MKSFIDRVTRRAAKPDSPTSPTEFNPSSFEFRIYESPDYTSPTFIQIGSSVHIVNRAPIDEDSVFSYVVEPQPQTVRTEWIDFIHRIRAREPHIILEDHYQRFD